MRSNKVDYPNRRYVSFSNEQWELMRKASDATGNTLMFLVRKWCEAGAKQDVAGKNIAQSTVEEARTQAIGWAWAEACIQLDAGKDPREYNQAELIDRAKLDLENKKPEGEQ